MIVGDYLVANALQSGFLFLRSNPQQVEQFLMTLRDFYPATYQQAIQWFANNTPSVILGYPAEPPATGVALCSITLSGENESEQFIGDYLDYDLDYDVSGNAISYNQTFGSFVSLAFDIHCMALGNQNLVIWVAQAIMWTLRAQRNNLEENGLMEQKLQIGDLDVDQQFLSDGSVVYTRKIRLSAKAPDIVRFNYNKFLREIDLTVIDDEDPTNPSLQ